MQQSTLAVITEWDSFKMQDFRDLQQMEKPAFVFDGRKINYNQCNRLASQLMRLEKQKKTNMCGIVGYIGNRAAYPSVSRAKTPRIRL